MEPPTRFMGFREYVDRGGRSRVRMDLLRRDRGRSEFEAFAARHVDGLVRMAYLMVGDQGDAEDLVQECLVQVARRWPRVRSMRLPGAYSRRVLFNLILDGSRAHARRQQELGDEGAQDQASSDARLAHAEERLELVDALAGLPDRQRAVLVLRYFADLPEAEIATILECAPGTVKSSASRGLSSLRDALSTQSQARSGSDDTIQGAETWIHR